MPAIGDIKHESPRVSWRLNLLRGLSYEQAEEVFAEVRERAVRLVLDHVDESPTEWAAIVSVAEKTGPSAQTLQNWLKVHRLANGIADAALVEQSTR